MTKFLFVPYLLRLLSQGTFFRKLFFYFFRVGAGLFALLGLVACAGLLRTVLNLPAVGVIGGFVFIALLAVAFYAVAHIFWTRADDIKRLSDAKFTMIPIYSIMVKTIGEVLAAFVAVLSIGGFILFLFAPREAGGMLGQFLPLGPLGNIFEQSGGNSFLTALLVLLGGAVYAVLLLAIFYLAGEFVSAIAEIAISTGLTATYTAQLAGVAGGAAAPPVAFSTQAATTSPTPLRAVPQEAAPRSAERICGTCGAANPAGAAFCENCGSRL